MKIKDMFEKIKSLKWATMNSQQKWAVAIFALPIILLLAWKPILVVLWWIIVSLLIGAAAIVCLTVVSVIAISIALTMTWAYNTLFTDKQIPYWTYMEGLGGKESADPEPESESEIEIDLMDGEF